MPLQFYTLYEQKISNLRPLLFVTFPQEFRKSKKFGHWTSGSGGKKTFKRSKQMKKNWRDKKLPRRFYTLYEQKFSNLWTLPLITFPQGFRISKKFGHWTSESGGKKTFKRSEQMKKICKKLFFAAAILHLLGAKVFKYETTSFHYFSPRIPNL